jgi:hypothetical protein
MCLINEIINRDLIQVSQSGYPLSKPLTNNFQFFNVQNDNEFKEG